jgi:chromatin remodeling complex protein RSC6
MSSTNTSSTSTMNAPASGKKSVKKSTPEVAAPPAPAATPAPAPAAPKKATPKPSPVASAPAPVVATPAPVVEASSTQPVADVSLADELKTLQDQLTSVRDSANAALASLKRVAKRAAADIKAAGKKRKNRSSEGTDGEGAAPKHNNLLDPVAISDELAAFLGMGKNSTGVRPEITKAMNKYAKDHSLTDGQKIKPNAALKKLLRIDDSVELTIFNLQTYLKPHFPPSKSAIAKAAKTA